MTAREIGPIGTLARVVGGALAITIPIALDGFTWPEAVIALLALPLIALTVLAKALAARSGSLVSTAGSRLNATSAQLGAAFQIDDRAQH